MFKSYDPDFFVNEFTWNRNASVLYIESPPGVGFSINKNDTYEYTDNNTGIANLNSVLKFLERFPEY